MSDQIALPGISPAAPSKPRSATCTRDVDAGPGSCWHYWEMCPAKVADCYTREMRAIADRHGVGWRQPITPDMQADIDAMHQRRREEA